MNNWQCLNCGNFVRGKRFCTNSTCKLMRFRVEHSPILAYFGMKLGTLSDGIAFNFPLGKLVSHTLITGMTGSGKTRFGMKLAVKAENEPNPHKIKLLIMDVEGEWKNIIPKLREKTEYYSVSKNLKINPFDLKDYALIRDLFKHTVFKEVMEDEVDLSAQMDKVLQDAIYESNNMQELIKNIENYQNRKLNSLQKTKTALLVRLDPFTRSPLKEIFMCDKSAPNFEKLGEKNMIIDLHDLDKLVSYNPEVRLIYNVITTYFLRKMLNRDVIDWVENLFLADEAQLLVPKILRKLIVTETWPATTIATRLRKRGTGLVLLTQRPSNLERDIVDNCSFKFSFRMQNQEDIKILCDSVGFIDITELEYMTDKFVNLPTQNGIACISGYEPFLFTADDFQFQKYEPAIAETRQTDLDPMPRKKTNDETMFLESVRLRPFLSVVERRKVLGWSSKKYSKTADAMTSRGEIEKVEVRLGRGSPRILYQTPGTVPSVKHEFYVHMIAEELKSRGFVVKLNKKEGPDIEIPKIRTAIEVELGKSDMLGNMDRDVHEFEKIIVFSDEKKVLDALSRVNKSPKILVSPIHDLASLPVKMQA